MFGRATIRLGIGPHSSIVLDLVSLLPCQEVDWEHRLQNNYFVSSFSRYSLLMLSSLHLALPRQCSRLFPLPWATHQLVAVWLWNQCVTWLPVIYILPKPLKMFTGTMIFTRGQWSFQPHLSADECCFQLNLDIVDGRLFSLWSAEI